MVEEGLRNSRETRFAAIMQSCFSGPEGPLIAKNGISKASGHCETLRIDTLLSLCAARHEME